jgi:hypothetical protein
MFNHNFLMVDGRFSIAQIADIEEIPKEALVWAGIPWMSG